MEGKFFIRGLLIGFSIAAPVGPIGALCIRRTLSDGRAAGFVSGMGAATADAAYGAVAAFGLTAISDFLQAQQFWLRLAGGLFLVWLGAKTYLSRPAGPESRIASSGLASAYATTLFLTLTNPMTIFSFIGIFAGLGLGAGGAGNHFAASQLVLGVFIGSALWWLLLSGGVGLFRSGLDATKLVWVNRLSGLIIFAFGALALLAASAKSSPSR
ncbi:MAG: LysE family transporter [Verrucomicrobiota bacterium]